MIRTNIIRALKNALSLEEGVEGYTPLMFIFLRVMLGAWLMLFMFRLDSNLHHIFLENGIYAGIRPPLPFPFGFSYVDEGQVRLFQFIFYSLTFLFIIGFQRRAVTIVLVLMWMNLHFKSALVPYPADGSIGYTLLATLFIPDGENGYLKGEVATRWYFPKGVYFILWLSFCSSLLFSAVDKFIAYTWRHGDALNLILNQVNAKDSFFTNLLLSLSDPFLTFLNYFVLLAEFILPLLCFFEWGRKVFVISFAIMLFIFDQTLMVREVAWGTFTCLLFLIHPKWLVQLYTWVFTIKDYINERKQYT